MTEVIIAENISENGLNFVTMNQLDNLEYKFNNYKNKTNQTISQLQEDNYLLKTQVEGLRVTVCSSLTSSQPKHGSASASDELAAAKAKIAELEAKIAQLGGTSDNDESMAGKTKRERKCCMCNNYKDCEFFHSSEYRRGDDCRCRDCEPGRKFKKGHKRPTHEEAVLKFAIYQNTRKID